MARGRGRRTDYNWDNFGDVMDALDLSTTDAQFGTQGLVSGEAATITRVRGRIGVTLNAAAANEDAIILVGLTVVKTDAFIAAATPEISTTASPSDEASWLWQGAIYVSSGAEAAVITDGLIRDLEVDSKAMRKVKANDTLALVIHTPAKLVTDQGGTFDLTYFFHCLLGV